jgi:hypothetical protein
VPLGVIPFVCDIGREKFMNGRRILNANDEDVGVSGGDEGTTLGAKL